MAQRRQRNKARQLAALQRRIQVATLWNELTAAKHPRPQTEIARQLGVTMGTISKDLTALKIAWQATAVDRIGPERERQLDSLAWIRDQARAEWERSKLPGESTTIEQDVMEVQQPDGSVRRQPTGKGSVKKQTKGQTGAPAYLETMRGAEADRRKILGLDAPVKSTTVNVDLSRYDLNDDEEERLLAGEPWEAVFLAYTQRKQSEAPHAA